MWGMEAKRPWVKEGMVVPWRHHLHGKHIPNPTDLVWDQALRSGAVGFKLDWFEPRLRINLMWLPTEQGGTLCLSHSFPILFPVPFPVSLEYSST